MRRGWGRGRRQSPLIRFGRQGGCRKEQEPQGLECAESRFAVTFHRNPILVRHWMPAEFKRKRRNQPGGGVIARIRPARCSESGRSPIRPKRKGWVFARLASVFYWKKHAACPRPAAGFPRPAVPERLLPSNDTSKTLNLKLLLWAPASVGLDHRGQVASVHVAVGIEVSGAASAEV